MTGPLHRRDHRLVEDVDVGENGVEPAALRSLVACPEQLADVALPSLLGDDADVHDRAPAGLVERAQRHVPDDLAGPVEGQQPRGRVLVGQECQHLRAPAIATDESRVVAILAIERPVGAPRHRRRVALLAHLRDRQEHKRLVGCDGRRGRGPREALLLLEKRQAGRLEHRSSDVARHHRVGVRVGVEGHDLGRQGRQASRAAVNEVC